MDNMLNEEGNTSGLQPEVNYTSEPHLNNVDYVASLEEALPLQSRKKLVINEWKTLHQ
jgi:hypothetical protein